MRILIRVVLSSLVVLALPGALSANTIYEYVGHTFGVVGGVYAPGDHITGMFELSDAFAGPPCPLCTGIGDVTPGVVAWSFTDGHQTLTEANSTGYFALNWANGPPLPVQGERFESDVRISSPNGSMRSLLDGSWRVDVAVLGAGSMANPGAWPLEQAGNYGNYGYNCVLDTCLVGGPGTWTAQAVPEPGTLVLLTSALIAVGAGVWRRRTTMPR